MDEKKKTNLLTLLIIVMLVGIGVVGYLLIDLNQDYDQLQTEMDKTVSAKELIKEDLEVLYSDYDSIQTENDSMASKLKREKEKISVLIDEIKTVKANNARVIRKYKDEVETLRTIMKSYVHQIDSLNTLNTKLVAENNEVREDNERLKYEMDEVVNVNDELESTVEKASRVKAADISISPYKKDNFLRNDKETSNAGKVDRFEVSFTLVENEIAEKGSKTIYLRIVRPDDYLLINDDNNIFTYQEKSIGFSASREVQYEGKFLDVKIYYDVQQSLLPGKYQVYLFLDNYQIGQSTFVLE